MGRGYQMRHMPLFGAAIGYRARPILAEEGPDRRCWRSDSRRVSGRVDDWRLRGVGQPG